MSRLTRRRLLKLGGMAAAGAVGSLGFPGLVAGADAQHPRALSSAFAGTEVIAPGVERRAASTTTPPAAGSVYRALDTDFGSSGVQSQAWFDAAKAEGYDGFVTTLHTFWDARPAAWTPSHVALERALSAGMWVAAYGRPVSRWREALSHVPAELREQLRFFALDVELEPGGQHHPMKAEYADGVANVFGVRPVIYTGWGMWGDVMGYENSSFGDIPLWDFSGDRFHWPATLLEEGLVPFGGWNGPGNHRVGWQIQMQSPAQVHGVWADRDLFSRAFIDAP